MKLDELNDVPDIVLEFLEYHSTVRGHSDRTVMAYYLDLKILLRFLKRRRHLVDRSVPFDEIEGDGKAYMCSINISPFFGSSGGEHLLLNEESEMYDIPEPQYMVPGYIFVPDGSGALIRFADNDMAFTEYVGSVYGQDPGAGQYYSNTLGDAVPLKDPSMPVFGVAHGDRQAGFVAYATSGEEYMQIVARPEGNKSTNYNWVYPRFTYNDIYYQVYNQNGDGFFTLNDVVNDFDLEITYKLLSGDGSKDGYPADYVGMAKAYRDHLISEGILTPVSSNESDIPVRVDFIMSDVKSGVVGNTSVSVTTAEDVNNILESLKNDGVSNINTGLIGWQKGGTILARADKAKYNPLLGSKKDFESSAIITFGDDAQIAAWAKPYVDDISAKVIVKGDNYGNFNPKKDLTRAETSVIIANIR